VRIDRFTAQAAAGLDAPLVQETLPLSRWGLLAPRAIAEKLRVLLDRAGLYDGTRRITPIAGTPSIAIPLHQGPNLARTLALTLALTFALPIFRWCHGD